MHRYYIKILHITKNSKTYFCLIKWIIVTAHVQLIWYDIIINQLYYAFLHSILYCLQLVDKDPSIHSFVLMLWIGTSNKQLDINVFFSWTNFTCQEKMFCCWISAKQLMLFTFRLHFHCHTLFILFIWNSADIFTYKNKKNTVNTK